MEGKKFDLANRSYFARPCIRCGNMFKRTGISSKICPACHKKKGVTKNHACYQPNQARFKIFVPVTKEAKREWGKKTAKLAKSAVVVRRKK